MGTDETIGSVKIADVHQIFSLVISCPVFVNFVFISASFDIGVVLVSSNTFEEIILDMQKVCLLHRFLQRSYKKYNGKKSSVPPPLPPRPSP